MTYTLPWTALKAADFDFQIGAFSFEVYVNDIRLRPLGGMTSTTDA